MVVRAAFRRTRRTLYNGRMDAAAAPSPDPPLPPVIPRVYRAMKRVVADDLPEVGTVNSSQLGARPGPDVTVDAAKDVVLDGKGMSVAPAWRDLDYTRIPRRLRPNFLGAAGPNSSACFAHGVGPFQAGAINADLVLAPDAGAGPVTHGVVSPSQVMPEAQYNGAIAATRPNWVIDEA